MNETIIKKLVCPYDHNPVVLQGNDYFECEKCCRHYPIGKEGVIDFLPDSLRSRLGEDGSESTILEKPENTGRWQPGLRYWTPGFFTKILRHGG